MTPYVQRVEVNPLEEHLEGRPRLSLYIVWTSTVNFSGSSDMDTYIEPRWTNISMQKR